MDEERQRFEQWYATHALNHERDPIGSRDCGLQWAAWQAGSESHRAELAACRAAAVYLFNCGYMRGHHDTVEACFVDIHDSDMRTYQSDVVAEVIDEALTARKSEGDGE